MLVVGMVVTLTKRRIERWSHTKTQIQIKKRGLLKLIRKRQRRGESVGATQKHKYKYKIKKEGC